MRSNPYKEQGRTIVTQLAMSLTRITTRSSLFKQSVSARIPDGEPFFNVDQNVAVDVPHTISGINHLLYIKTPQKVNLEIEKDGVSITQEVDGLYVFHGKIDGVVKITSALEEPVMCNLVYS